MIERPYIFLGENLETSLGDPVRLFDNYFLTRPTKIEKGLLTFFIEKNTHNFNPNNPFQRIEQKNETFERTDNFWIVVHEYNSASWTFEGIIGLSSVNLTVLLEWFILPPDRKIMKVDDLLSKVFYHDYYSSNNLKTIIDQNVIMELENMSLSFNSYFYSSGDVFGYKRIIEDFLAIKKISRVLPFRFLSYFSILESLLTNNKYKISSNSINYQLQHKLNLINNKLEDPLDFRVYFNTPDSVTFETIIEKLYQYRSDIAHGNISNFDKELSILKDSKPIALQFIHELTRRVILFGLKEPQLVNDLKNC